MVKHEVSDLVVKQFSRQHYCVVFNQRTGFFARIEESKHEEPFWSWHGPELLDIAITNWCDRECAICYRSSNQNGKHMPVHNYEIIMQQAQYMHVFQVALGGGNPNQHPEFCDILRLTREKYGIVPSYTTNGRGLTEEVLLASKKYCGAVAVSAYSPYEEMADAISLLTEYGIKTNVHFVLDSYSISTALNWLATPPEFLNNVNAIVFLNYKPVGRCKDQTLLLRNSDVIAQFFKTATSRKYHFKVGFDSCLVSGLVRFSNIPEIFYEGCDASRFSMFISENLKMYPCSFMVADYDGIPIQDGNMLETWHRGELFVQIRETLAAGHRQNCAHAKTCLGGCPVFEEINLCSNRETKRL